MGLCYLPYEFTPNIVYKNCPHFGLHISGDYFSIAPLEIPTSLRSSLQVSLRVCIVVSFPEGYLGKFRADCVAATVL